MIHSALREFFVYLKVICARAIRYAVLRVRIIPQTKSHRIHTIVLKYVKYISLHTIVIIFRTQLFNLDNSGEIHALYIICHIFVSLNTSHAKFAFATWASPRQMASFHRKLDTFTCIYFTACYNQEQPPNKNVLHTPTSFTTYS